MRAMTLSGTSGIIDAGEETGRFVRLGLAALVVLGLVIAANPALALEENVYRQFLGIDSRRLVWFLAQMHLFFGAFVLGVPLFAVIIEIVGWNNKDPKFDKLAYEFTSLLSVAYATTAALGATWPVSSKTSCSCTRYCSSARPSRYIYITTAGIG
jgi:hypothetical protein